MEQQHKLPGEDITQVLLDDIPSKVTTQKDQRLDRPVSYAIEDSRALINKEVNGLDKEDLIRLIGVLMNECNLYSQKQLWEMLEERREAQEYRLEEFSIDSSENY